MLGLHHYWWLWKQCQRFTAFPFSTAGCFLPLSKLWSATIGLKDVIKVASDFFPPCRGELPSDVHQAGIWLRAAAKKGETLTHRCAADMCLPFLPLLWMLKLFRGWREELFSKVSFIPRISSQTGLLRLLFVIYSDVFYGLLLLFFPLCCILLQNCRCTIPKANVIKGTSSESTTFMEASSENNYKKVIKLKKRSCAMKFILSFLNVGIKKNVTFFFLTDIHITYFTVK